MSQETYKHFCDSINSYTNFIVLYTGAHPRFFQGGFQISYM